MNCDDIVYSFTNTVLSINFKGSLYYPLLKQNMVRTRLTFVSLTPDTGLFLWVEGSANERDKYNN